MNYGNDLLSLQSTSFFRGLSSLSVWTAVQGDCHSPCFGFLKDGCHLCPGPSPSSVVRRGCRCCTCPVALWVTAAQWCGPRSILSRATISNVQRHPSINHPERIWLPEPKHLGEKENIPWVFPLISREYSGCPSTRKCFFFLFCFLAE